MNPCRVKYVSQIKIAVKWDWGSNWTVGSLQFGDTGTFALAHDEAMMGHIKDALSFSLLLYRGTAALNALPDLAPTMTHFILPWEPQHEALKSTRGKLVTLKFHRETSQPHYVTEVTVTH